MAYVWAGFQNKVERWVEMMTTVCCKHVSLRVTSTGTSYQYTTTTMITIMMMMMTIIGAGDRAQAGNMAFNLTYGGQEDCAGIVTIVFITFVSITVVIITVVIITIVIITLVIIIMATARWVWVCTTHLA